MVGASSPEPFLQTTRTRNHLPVIKHNHQPFPSQLFSGRYNSCIFEKKSKTRCVKLEITSFRGISWGAIHYYGKLIADGIDFQIIEDPRTTTSNWGAKKINPFYQWTYEFRLRRPLTEDEINSDPDRWDHYAPGDFTDCFNTKDELIAIAIECFKKRFTGEWELWMVDETVIKNGRYQIEI